MKICIIKTVLMSLIVLAFAQIPLAQTASQAFNIAPVDTSNENETASTIHDRRKVPSISRLAINHLEKHYVGHSPIDWYVYEDGIVAKFERNQLSHRSIYTSDGSWKHSIVNYPPDRISELLKQTVKGQYPEFDIVRGFEVHTRGSKPRMIVLVENGTEVKQLVVFGKRLIPIGRLRSRT